MNASIRNICIIAHVDHGKTTLVDHLLRQAGTYRSHEALVERVMDSDDQERERGITISAKNASFNLGSIKVNVVDTPGHADFGGEVERIMGMVDGAILLVDAAEGPLPQTRFVLQNAIRKGLKIALCINKIDRPEVQGNDLINQCVDRVFDLFVELGASDAQCDFPIVYACARHGWCVSDLDSAAPLLQGQGGGDLVPLYNLITEMPSPKTLDSNKVSLLVSNIAYSDYIGSLALGRVSCGTIRIGQQLIRHCVDAKGNPVKQKFQATKLLTYQGLKQHEVNEIVAGDIGLVAGCDDYQIGDTVGEEDSIILDRIKVEEPTMRMIFSINTTPNSGKDGKAIQSRELRERLIREARNNVALRLQDGDTADQFYLYGRGELQFGIIIEKLRREGLEFMVGRPNVLLKVDERGKKLEPYEKLVLDLPEQYSGDVTKLFQGRKGTLLSYENIETNGGDPRIRLSFEIPTRGLLGTNSAYKTATRGTGLVSSEILGYKEFQGDLAHRAVGSIVSDRAGKTTAYALFTIQDRGILFVGEGEEVYEGMIIGECAKDNDLNVNACRPKKLTNMRTTSSDGITILQGTRKMTLERCIEWIDDDEWIEVTPKFVRLRKKILSAANRSVRREERMN